MGEIYYPSTYLCMDRVALTEFFSHHYIHTYMCVSIFSYGRAYFTRVRMCAHTSSLPFASLLLASFEPLPLCGGSHLALFKEILMALDGILRPNFAAGNFAESENPSHPRALSRSPSQFSLPSPLINNLTRKISRVYRWYK